MSEATFPFKKAIPIIVVTWILSLVTTLAIVYVAPNIFPPTWHEVAKFAGDSLYGYTRETTDVFCIKSNHWRIECSVLADYPPSEDAEFRFYVDQEGGGVRTLTFRRLTPSDFEWKNSFIMSEYITGSGSYSIEVVAYYVLWGIIVEAYY